jgi:hypothetical protein
MIAVGVRGMARPQGFAALLTVAEIAERLSPEELTGLPYALSRHPGMQWRPWLCWPVAPLLARRGYRWGPGGRVGFELGTRVATATASRSRYD